MGLEKVVEEILERAEREAAEAMRKAEEGARRIKDEARQRMSRDENEAVTALREELSRVRAYELAKAEIEAKKLILEAQKQVLSETYEATRKRLQSLPEKENRAVLGELLDKALGEMKEGYLYCAEKDRSFVGAFKAYAHKGSIEGGGIIIENMEQTIRLNLSYPTLLKDVWERHIKEVSEVLFGD